MKKWLSLLCLLAVIATGCSSAPSQSNPADNAPLPVFSLTNSEYPSWSVFSVADTLGVINGKEGLTSDLEKEYGVDMVLKEADYDTCIQLYGAKKVDAACLTNMDCLNPALGRPTTALFPTSTSFGADACVVVGYNSVKELKGVKVYGLEKSVSEYAFVRSLEEMGENPDEYQFQNMDPAAAAQAIQTKSPNVKAIFVWNPFKMQTLETREDSKVLFDSTKIPGEIIDMVVMGNDSLARPNGTKFAALLAKVYYTVCARLNDPQTRETTLVALGAKFSNLPADKMAICCKETQFYDTPEKGLAIFESKELPKIMDKVVGFCVKRKIIDLVPLIQYGMTNDKNALSFDPIYMKGDHLKPVK